MSKCPQCGIEVEVGSNFCAECGNPIPRMKECPKCHTQLKQTVKFCAECGYDFMGERAAGVGGAVFVKKDGGNTTMTLF